MNKLYQLIINIYILLNLNLKNVKMICKINYKFQYYFINKNLK